MGQVSGYEAWGLTGGVERRLGAFSSSLKALERLERAGVRRPCQFSSVSFVICRFQAAQTGQNDGVPRICLRRLGSSSSVRCNDAL